MRISDWSSDVCSSDLLAGCFYFTGVDIFPKTDAGQAQVRLRLKTGTRLERTEEATQKLLQIAGEIVGKENIDISSAFVGTQPSAYPVNLIHLWTSGPHESDRKSTRLNSSH